MASKIEALAEAVRRLEDRLDKFPENPASGASKVISGGGGTKEDETTEREIEEYLREFEKKFNFRPNREDWKKAVILLAFPPDGVRNTPAYLAGMKDLSSFQEALKILRERKTLSRSARRSEIQDFVKMVREGLDIQAVPEEFRSEVERIVKGNGHGI